MAALSPHVSAGTACGHIDEDIFDDELMTGYVDDVSFLKFRIHELCVQLSARAFVPDASATSMKFPV